MDDEAPAHRVMGLLRDQAAARSVEPKCDVLTTRRVIYRIEKIFEEMTVQVGLRGASADYVKDRFKEIAEIAAAAAVGSADAPWAGTHLELAEVKAMMPEAWFDEEVLRADRRLVRQP